MPYSSPETKPLFRKWIKEKNPQTMLDVGIGYGEMGRIAKEEVPNLEVDGIEVWLPYLANRKCSLKSYKRIIVADALDLIDKMWEVDITIFYDVLEHFKREDAIRVLKYYTSISRMGLLVCVPLGDYPQGTCLGNSYEAHLDTWQAHELEALGGKPVYIGKRNSLFEFTR